MVLLPEASKDLASDVANVAAKLKDPSQWQIHMQTLVREGASPGSLQCGMEAQTERYWLEAGAIRKERNGLQNKTPVRLRTFHPTYTPGSFPSHFQVLYVVTDRLPPDL